MKKTRLTALWAACSLRPYLMAALLAAGLACGCNSSKVRISGKFVGLNAQTVYLEQMSLAGQTLIDSTALASDGSYAFTVAGVAHTPSMYNIVYNGERIPLLLSGGEKVNVGAMGSVLLNYTVSGSPESELLRDFNRQYISGVQTLNSLIAEYSQSTEENRGTLAHAYNRQYLDVKRTQISFIVEHKGSIAAVYALYQRLPGEQSLVGNDSDIIYYRTVADAVAESYPDSPYLISLRNDVARMEARASLLQSVEERSYPDLSAPDMFGQEIKLSSLDGNVILVDFWSAELGNSNALNADLKEIYRKYESSGFRVYQVAVDTSKATWVKAVQEQKLPWVSVCDFRGEGSPLPGTYNVQKLPSNFLIDRDGTIIGKDLYSTALERKLAEIFK